MITELEKLAEQVGLRLIDRGEMLATAESCTGGWVAQSLTAIAGSSAWFDRGFVTYSNAAKVDMLGVPETTLARQGAVSEATARAMALGALVHSRAHWALAITGIAGPTGGTIDKPVGTVCFGVSILRNEQFDVGVSSFSKSYYLIGNRDTILESSAQNLLNYLRSCLKECGII